jgi:hypothetical protein
MNMLDPVWNHVQTLSAFVVGDKLQFSVFDENAGLRDDRHDLLGQVTLSKEDYYPKGFDGKVKLVNTGSGCSKAMLILKVTPLVLKLKAEEGTAYSASPLKANRGVAASPPPPLSGSPSAPPLQDCENLNVPDILLLGGERSRAATPEAQGKAAPWQLPMEPAAMTALASVGVSYGRPKASARKRQVAPTPAPHADEED